MKKIITFLTIIFTFGAIAADPKIAYSKAQKGEAVLIDVREEDEIKEGMIKGAKWFPLSRLTNGTKWKKEFNDLVGKKMIALYCRTGKRSEKVMNILKENRIQAENIGGFEKLKHILPVR